MSSSLEIYAFVDSKQQGGYPVFGIAGDLVAGISVSPWTRKFTATDAASRVLCHGRPRFWSQTYLVEDGAGRLMFEVRSSFWHGRKRTIALPPGAELTLRGARWPSRDWQVTDSAGRVVLGITTTRAASRSTRTPTRCSSATPDWASRMPSASCR